MPSSTPAAPTPMPTGCATTGCCGISGPDRGPSPPRVSTTRGLPAPLVAVRRRIQVSGVRFGDVRRVLDSDLHARLNLGQRRQNVIEHLLGRRLVAVARRGVLLTTAAVLSEYGGEASTIGSVRAAVLGTD